MIDFSGTYAKSFRLVHVDEESWGDGEIAPGFLTLDLTRNCTDDLPLLEAATLTVENDPLELFKEGFYRVQMLAYDGLDRSRYNIATLLLRSSDGRIDRGVDVKNVNGYSVLKPCEERILEDDLVMPVGADGSLEVEDLLNESTPAPVENDGGFILNDYVVIPAGTTYLAAIWTILDKAGWVLMLDGDGTIHICDKPMEPVFIVDRPNLRYFKPGITYDNGLADIPNRYIVYGYDGSKVIVENDDEDSRTSFQQRGRWIDVYDDNPTRINGESYETYAKRQLESLSVSVNKATYVREYHPDIKPFSLIESWLPQTGMIGSLRVLSQHLTVGQEFLVEEQVGKETFEWSAS